MAITYGTMLLDGREESYAESDEYTFAGDSYVVRFTAMFPYRERDGNFNPLNDKLRVTIDFMNVTQGTSGRYYDVFLPERGPGDNNLRRFSAYNAMNQLLATTTPIPSPVFP